MWVLEVPVCLNLFRQNLVFTSLHLKSSVHVVPPLVDEIHVVDWSIEEKTGLAAFQAQCLGRGRCCCWCWGSPAGRAGPANSGTLQTSIWTGITWSEAMSRICATGTYGRSALAVVKLSIIWVFFSHALVLVLSVRIRPCWVKVEPASATIFGEKIFFLPIWRGIYIIVRCFLALPTW